MENELRNSLSFSIDPLLEISKVKKQKKKKVVNIPTRRPKSVNHLKVKYENNE